jgi:hypothetical protein
MCGSAPDAPTLPQFPGLSSEETAILQKEGLSLDQFDKIIQGTGTSLEQNKNVLQQISGLYDAQGNLDQNALADLKSRTQGQLTQAQGVGSSALGYLQNYFGGSGGATGTPGSAGVAQVQSDTYKAALEGTGAVNAATTQQQQRDFIALKDSLSQRGIMVTGDSIQNATSDSTAGQRAIQLLQQNQTAQNSSERLGYIQTLGGQVAGTVGQAQGSSTAGVNAANTQLGYVNNAATTSATTMAPLLSQYQSNLNQYYQPYQTQQLGAYQQQLDQANMNYTAGLNQYNATQNQIMGWGQIGAQLGSTAIKAAAK